MGKKTEDGVLDAAWLEIANNATEMTICQGEPADWTEATTELGTGQGKVLARVNMTGGDFTRGAGDGTPTGRKQTVAAKSGLTVLQTGNADHVALVDAVSRLFYVTTATSQPVTASNTLDTSAWDTDIDGPV